MRIFLDQATKLHNYQKNLKIRVATFFSLWYNGGVIKQSFVHGEFQNKTKVTEFDFEALLFIKR